jgi:hypothetical protein
MGVPYEDEALRTLVERHGIDDWNAIADRMPNRSATQCRERWNNYLSPIDPSSFWTQNDDNLLIQKARDLGHKWNQIAEFFPNQSDMNCRDRWYTLDAHHSQPPSQPPSLFQRFLNGVYHLFNGPSEVERRIQAFKKKLAPQGLKMEWDYASVFDEDLCGYSALLAAVRLDKIDPRRGGNITIRYSEVRRFADDLKESLVPFNTFIDVPLNMDCLDVIAQILGYPHYPGR